MANQELRCDAVIIGGGLAGLAAGIRLRKLGRYPIVLEAKEDELYANNTRWGGRGAPLRHERLLRASPEPGRP